MFKVFLIIGIIYLVYYAGNIIYDLFIRKDLVTGAPDTSEVFAIGDAADAEPTFLQNVEIDDVEDVITPNTYANHSFSHPADNTSDTADTDAWRKRFEAEQDIDNYSDPVGIDGTTAAISSNEISSASSSSSAGSSNAWKDLFRKAETSVQLVKSIDGYKVYKTTL